MLFILWISKQLFGEIVATSVKFKGPNMFWNDLASFHTFLSVIHTPPALDLWLSLGIRPTV